MDAVAMDLNTDISKQYNWTEKFDLVTNYFGKKEDNEKKESVKN